MAGSRHVTEKIPFRIRGSGRQGPGCLYHNGRFQRPTSVKGKLKHTLSKDFHPGLPGTYFSEHRVGGLIKMLSGGHIGVLLQ